MTTNDDLSERIAPDINDPRIQAALEELRSLVLQHYPTATFVVYEGEDPVGIYLTPIVDVEDLEEVADVFTDRLVHMQVEEGLPVYVVPDIPLERAAMPRRPAAAAPVKDLISLVG